MKRLLKLLLLVLISAVTGPLPANAAGSGTTSDPYTTLADAYRVPSSGRYFFNTGSGTFAADVDTSNGGGWVLVLQYVHLGGTNPALSVIGAGANLPVTSTAALGADESADTTRWGHAGNAAMSQFTGNIELRFFGQTSGHTRTLHFRTPQGDDYVRTGTGQIATGLATNFTSLGGNNAFLPATTNGGFQNQGDSALTNFPFFQGATRHWGIRGQGTRWEVDDFANSSVFNTIHRVWVRSETPLAVTNTNDSGEGSLRQAMLVANSNASLDAISFNIPGTGPHTITLASALPTITDAGVSINGITQPGAACGDLWAGTPHSLQVRINKSGFTALTVGASNVTIRGLSITGSGVGGGISVSSGASNTSIQCNYIGLAPDGSAAGNSRGVEVFGANAVIGGLSAGEGNVISSNSLAIFTLNGSTATAIRGNFIGTDPAGMAARPNTNRAINNFNGTASWSDITRNLISGNTGATIVLESDDTITPSSGTLSIAGNYIGVNRTGTAALANIGHGIDFRAGAISNVVIGGINAADRNIISGNTAAGIALGAQTGAAILGNTIGLDAAGSIAIANGAGGIQLIGTTNTQIGDGTSAGRNLISGNNGGAGVLINTNASGISILGNYIGTDATGLIARRNANNGITINQASGITIGNATTGGRNVISGNGPIGINAVNGASGITILGNYIGLGADGLTTVLNDRNGIGLATVSNVQIGDGTAAGRNVISGNGNGGGFAHGLLFASTTNLTLAGNYIGVAADGATARPNSRNGIMFQSLATQTGHSNAIVRDNVISANGTDGVDITSTVVGALGASSTITFTGNKVGVAADGVTARGNGGAGIKNTNVPGLITIGGTGAGQGNIIAHNTGPGYFATSLPIITTLIANSIHSNGGLGIDLGNDGVTANDAGDGDTGPNNLLNYPTFAALNVASGGALSYRFDLDAPAEANGYRIDFYRNSTADATGFGEGEIWLGAIDTGNHAGGSVQYTGTFTPLAAVAAGNLVSATATRKTGPASFAETSEFNQNATIVTPLVVTNTADSGAGSLRNAIEFANSEPAEDNISFNIPGSGVQLISLASALPALSDAGISIDGTNQPGAACGDLWAGTPHTLLVHLDGGNSSFLGPVANAANITIKGLALTRFSDGLRANSAASNAVFQCNYIGLAPDGTSSGNANGVRTFGAATLIGGLAPGEGNVISGNTVIGVSSANGASAMAVRGNFIGTDPTGSAARPNVGFTISNQNGTASWSDITRNLISGNNSNAIDLQGDDTVTASGSRVSIAGNFIGVDRTGTAALANGGSGIDFVLGTISNLTIGGTSADSRNVISGNGGNGIFLGSQSGVNIFGNYIGVGLDGSTDLGNAAAGIAAGNGASNLSIGNGTANGRNVIAGNEGRAISLRGGDYSGLIISDNYIGTDSSGNTMIASGAANLANGDAISLDAGATGNGLTITNNVVGGYRAALLEFFNSSQSNVTIMGNRLGVGADGVSNVARADSIEATLNLGGTGTSTDLVIGGTAPGQGNIIANSTVDGVFIQRAGSAIRFEGNTVRDNGARGIRLGNGSAPVSLLANTIFSNGGLGIDLGSDGVTANDPGDGDTGANNLLNFPTLAALNAASGGGLSYRFNLDAPAEANGYRIDFYRNSAADPTGFGEGEVWLGSIDTPAHPGGSVEYTGTLTPVAAVAAGNLVSATTTRKTGASSYAETSEFNQNATIVTPLVVTSTADSGAGSLRNAISYANAESTEDNITFNIPGTGPHTITLASSLPEITDAGVTIDGITQPGAACGDLWAGTPHTLRIRIDKTTSFAALLVDANDVTIRGLSITGIGNAINIRNPATNAIVQCNYLGLTPDGTASGVTRGVFVSGFNTLIGGSVAGQGNVISGNFQAIMTSNGSTGTAIRGNFIGTDPTGTSARPNTDQAITHILGNATWSDITRNLISGNTSNGIALVDDNITGSSGDVRIAGNYIGVNRTGTAALANSGNGISFASNNITGLTIGGTNAADRNIISGNLQSGIVINVNNDISILGNTIGLDAAGTNAIANGAGGIQLIGTTNTQIGDGTSAGRNLISGNNGGAGVLINTNASGISILGNYIGTDATGLIARRNANNGITINQASGITIGNATTGGRNVISGNGPIGIQALNGASNITILGNYIGLGADGLTTVLNDRNGIALATASNVQIGDGTAAGRNVISGNGNGSGFAHGLFFTDTANLTLAGNYIGVAADGVTARPNSQNGIMFQSLATQTGHSNAIVRDNVISANGTDGVDITSTVVGALGASSTITFTGNKVGVAADGVTARGNGGAGIKNTNVPGLITIGGTGAGQGNIIAHNTGPGYFATSLPIITTLIGNSIHSNGGLGIDLGIDGVTANDAGDGDTGPNNLLNFPVLRGFALSGGNLLYVADLDAPANPDGYRIEFFKNSSSDASGHGEGEIYLGFVETGNHPGGSQTYSGNFAPLAPVAVNDLISTTATRMTGPNSYAETSEFSVTVTGGTIDLDVAIVSSVYDPAASGLKAVPGNDIIFALTVTNSGDLPIDEDATFLVADIPADTIFFNGPTPEFANAAVGFVPGSSGVTFNPATDVSYSNSVSRPTSPAECTYTPQAGYDPAVTFICLNPKGIMTASGNPSFELRYRVQIK